MSRTQILAVIVIAAACITPAAYAKDEPEFLPAFLAAYPDTVGTKLDSCTVCHGAGFQRNDYANDWKDAGMNFAAIEGDDSDNDTFTNIAEITALTFPGDDTDHPTIDNTPPVITILGDNPASVVQGETYTDAGATANDNVDGDLTDEIITSGSVDTGTVATYPITYSVSDAAGNPAQAIRQVEVTAEVPVELSEFAIE